MAEREGFEPSVAFRLRSLSKGVLSTAQPSLQLCVVRGGSEHFLHQASTFRLKKVARHGEMGWI